MINYRIYLGESNCTACGKKHKKIFEINGKAYGSSCAKELLGKELNAPIWLYNLAEDYIKKFGVEKNWINTIKDEDFQTNFWNVDALNITWTGNFPRIYERPIKIDGKKITVENQCEIVEYIKNRYWEIRE